MELRSVTTGFIIATAVLWIGWDVYVWFLRGDIDATFSRIIMAWSQTKLGVLIVVALGVLMGHFFFDNKRWDLMIALGAGIAGGALFWRQRPELDEKDPADEA